MSADVDQIKKDLERLTKDVHGLERSCASGVKVSKDAERAMRGRLDQLKKRISDIIDKR